jgi:hypothetical protein
LQFCFKATTNTKPAEKRCRLQEEDNFRLLDIPMRNNGRSQRWGDKWCGRSGQQSPKNGKIKNLKKTIDLLR